MLGAPAGKNELMLALGVTLLSEGKARTAKTVIAIHATTIK
jgi:hypothetical protein